MLHITHLRANDIILLLLSLHVPQVYSRIASFLQMFEYETRAYIKYVYLRYSYKKTIAHSTIISVRVLYLRAAYGKRIRIKC